MTISEKQGDLFDCKDNLAHCVSEDLKMGKGIAKIFRNKFGGVADLKKQNKKPGQIAHLKSGDRHIFYMVTKERYFQKPKYQHLYESLVDLKDFCVSGGIKSVSMPKIGCGLDKLEWSMVKRYLDSIFKDTNIDITIYYL